MSGEPDVARLTVYLDGEPLPPDDAHTLVGARELVCALHRDHRPLPLRLVAHHVLPKASGGRTEPGNLAVICDTGHYNVHEILAALLAGKVLPGGFGSRSERGMAQRGHDLIQATHPHVRDVLPPPRD